MTISLWLNLTVQPNSATKQTYFFIGLDGTGIWIQNCSNYFGGTWDNNIYLTTYMQGALSNIQIISNPSLNTWYNIVCMFTGTGTNLTVYVNNVLTVNNITTSFTNGLTGKTYTKFIVGSNENPPANPANCLIDDLRIYNRALSVSEITTIYYYNL